MTRLDKLLGLLQEESAEVTQCASKCIRFGMEAVYKEQSNRFRLEQEIGDLLAILKLLSESKETNLDSNHIFECVESKLIRVEKYLQVD